MPPPSQETNDDVSNDHWKRFRGRARAECRRLQQRFGHLGQHGFFVECHRRRPVRRRDITVHRNRDTLQRLDPGRYERCHMHHYRRLKLVIGGYFLLFSALPLAQRGGAPVSSSWRRIRAADVILVGNAPERELQRNLEKIQAFRHAMNTLVSGLKESSGIPMTVVVFKDFDAFARFQPRDANGKRQNAAGYTMRSPSFKSSYHSSVEKRRASPLPAFQSVVAPRLTFHE